MDDATLKSLLEGAAVIEACLAKAVAADWRDAPMGLTGEQAKIWHQAQANAYRHALEQMSPPGHEPGILPNDAASEDASTGGFPGIFGMPGVAKSATIVIDHDPAEGLFDADGGLLPAPTPGRGGTSYEPVLSAMARRGRDATIDVLDQLRLQPSDEQAEAIAKIVSSHRTIIAGAPGTGRTTTAVLAARAWNASPESQETGPAFIIVADEAKRSRMIHSPEHDGSFTYTLADVRRLAEPATMFSRFGLVIVDDADVADATPANGSGTMLAMILRHADTRVARFVASGRNDDDATLVLTQTYRQ